MGIKTAADYGLAAQEYVAQWLVDQGFSIVARNYQLMSGEIDLIASNKDLLLFVEVKYRRNPRLAIEYLVPIKKQMRIIGTARRFMATYQRSSLLTCRFDVAVVVQYGQSSPQLTYFANAFVADE